MRPPRISSVYSLVGAFSFVQFLLVLWAKVCGTEIDNDFVQGACELERHLVVFADRCSGVFADVEGLIYRGAERNRSAQSAARGFLAINAQCHKAAFADAASVIFEVDSDGVLAGPQRVLG